MINDSVSPTVENCTFSGNSASDGGGMYNSSSSPTVTNCTFSGNSASGGDYVSGWGGGGGIYNDVRTGGSPTITNCTFSGNSASGDSGGYGGGICHSGDSLTVISGV